MLAAVIERPGAVTVRRPPGEAAQALTGAAEALAEAALALAATERPERLKIVLDVARP